MFCIIQKKVVKNIQFSSVKTKEINMINIEKNMNDSIPVFVPPRKRQTSKKQNGVQNYVDHIVNVQVC